jgi:hypothetical protein
MSALGKRPGALEYYGELKWVPAEEHFHYTEQVENNDYENYFVGAGKFRAVFDLKNCHKAWIAWVKPTGDGENKLKGGVVLRGAVPIGSGRDCGPKPSAHGLKLTNENGFEGGLIVRCKIDGGGRKEIISTQASFWYAMEPLYSEYLAEREKHPGKLPVVEQTGTQVYPGRKSMCGPKLKIVGWVERPLDLPDEAPEREDPPAMRQQQKQLRLVMNGPPPDEGPPPDYYDDGPPDERHYTDYGFESDENY